MTSRQPVKVVPPKIRFAYPVYERHMLGGRCRTTFDIAPFINYAARTMRCQVAGAIEEIQDRLTWTLAAIEYDDFVAALHEYDDTPTLFAIRCALAGINRVPCIECGITADPRLHTHQPNPNTPPMSEHHGRGDESLR